MKKYTAMGSILLASMLSINLHANVANTGASSGENIQSLQIDVRAEKWWETAIFYEIMPRSFKDSDNDGHGDFKGIVHKLDYLKNLGISAIWLTPVFEAPSYHGYDFEDFYRVEADYGSMQDFEEFIAESHERDIKVVLDLVLNHVSVNHPWFQKSANREQGYEDYFIWRDSIPENWGQPWGTKINPETVWHWNESRKQYYYAAFGSTQPDLNLTNNTVVNELNKVSAFWLNKGIDGFRLDAIRYAIEEGPLPLQADTQGTIAFWAQFAAYAKSIKSDVLLVGEAWTQLDVAGKYRSNGNGLDAAFDFDFGNYVAYVLNPEVTAVPDYGTATPSKYKHNRDALWANLQARRAAAPLNFFSAFLSNHDQNRIMHTLAGNINKAKIAASLLMTTPGSLYIYYGEEIGMSQYKTGNDLYRRDIMQWSDESAAGFNTAGNVWVDRKELFEKNAEYDGWWTRYWKRLQPRKKSVAAQEANPASLLNHYKSLINIRNGNVQLKSPQLLHFYPIENKDVWVVENISDGKSVWTLINLNPFSEATIVVPGALKGIRNDLLSGNSIALGETFTLNAAETFIFE